MIQQEQAVRRKILFVEDNKFDQSLFRQFVDKQGLPFDYKIAESVADALSALKAGRFDILILDYVLGDGTAFDIINSISDTPFIITTGMGDEDIAVKAMNMGAYYYLVKDSSLNYLNSLPALIANAIDYREMEQMVKLYTGHLEELVRERTVELLTANEYLSMILENLPVVVYTRKAEGDYDITYISSNVKDVTGYSPEDFTSNPGLWKSHIYPDDIQVVFANLSQILEKNNYRNDYRWLITNDKYRWFRDEFKLVKSPDGKSVHITGVLQDITERRQADEQIRASLREKGVLLSEVYHRVKNNLQTVSSLLSLQSRSIHDKQALEYFQETQNSIHSMAIIHEKLYCSKNFASVDFNDYVRDLTNYLFQAYGVDPAGIKLNIDIPDMSLNIDTAIPLGLIINELVSNCLKYAFRKRPEGEVYIQVYPDANASYNLIVRDNGAGFPKDMDFRKSESLGLKLITLLVQQLDGTIELNSNNGTEFKINFREQQYKKAGNPDNSAE